MLKYLYMKKICHLDFNYFFVQVEELINPFIRNRPVAVGSITSRGVISTANYIARKYGVKSGQPVSEARRLCPDLIIKPGHYSEYSKVSNQIFSYLNERFPILERTSIDECYFDATEYLNNCENERDGLRDIQFEIYSRFGIKCSIGLSFTRFLAKMASDMEKPLGLVILDKNNFRNIIMGVDIKDCYGIGKKTYLKLSKLGIKTISDLYNATNKEIINVLGNSFEGFKNCVDGNSTDIINTTSSDPQSCSAMETFNSDTNDYDEIVSCLSRLSKQVSDELIHYHKVAKTVVLTLRDSTFETHSRRLQMNEYSNDANVILETGLKIFDNFSESDTLFRLVGIGVENLKKESEVPKSDLKQKKEYEPINLFSGLDQENDKKMEDEEKEIIFSKDPHSYSVDELVSLFNTKLSSPLFKTSVLKDKINNEK